MTLLTLLDTLAEIPPDEAVFDPTLPALQDSMWSWTRAQDPASELAIHLGAVADSIDDLSGDIDLIWQSRSITTAQPADLLAQYAYVWGLLQEQLPSTQAALEQYILARSEENGSLASLINTLTVLIEAGNPQNQGGPVLIFDVGGAGLTFPSSGSGLVMYQYADLASAINTPTFPADGSGLTFPADGSGLMFSDEAWVTVSVAFPNYTVTVKSYLAFDRPSFDRAVQRFRPAHMYAGTVIEVNN